MTEKTHWLQNPNKNYLGHWDLPSGQDVILTIKSAGWKAIKNPITNSVSDGRVIEFKETYSWLKPFICNQVNAQSILKSTNEKFMEDCVGKRIKIGVSETKMYSKESSSMETVDCLRVRIVKQSDLEPKKINTNQVKEIQELVDKTHKSAADICGAYKVDSLKDLRLSSFASIVKNLKGMVKEVVK